MLAWLASWPEPFAIAWTITSSTILAALLGLAEHRDAKRRAAGRPVSDAGRRVSDTAPTSTRTTPRRTRPRGIA